MGDYKLSHTAEEVDELLGKVKSGICLDYADLETVHEVTKVTTNCTDADSALLEKLLAKKMPIVIHAKLTSSGTVIYDASAVFTYLESTEGACFMTILKGMQMVYAPIDGIWIAAMTSV